jgi:2-amino-4-hydroxy-6-hydroxymethyldihydropteridine diphosphokinase
MRPRSVAYIGLGANLAGPRRQVERAVDELAALPKSRLTAVSRLFRTAPVGPQDQPDFINAAARLETGLAPEALLHAMQHIERAHGRVRSGTRWGPRTLDLDLLLYDDLHRALPGLDLPHPEIARRAFVLVPLAEIAPAGLYIPGQGRLDLLLAAIDQAGVEPLDAAEQAGGQHAGPVGADGARRDERSGSDPEAGASAAGVAGMSARGALS